MDKKEKEKSDKNPNIFLWILIGSKAYQENDKNKSDRTSQKLGFNL